MLFGHLARTDNELIPYTLYGKEHTHDVYVNDIPVTQAIVANRQLYRATNRIPGATYVINIDNILALLGLVQVGAQNPKRKYFIEKDTGFL